MFLEVPVIIFATNMETTSYVGVYLLLKNKVFGSLRELFINSYSVKKGLMLCSSRC